MAYAVRSDYVARYGSAEADRLDPTPPGDGRIDAAIRAAGADMDSVLARAFSPVPTGTYPLLTQIALDLARERLHDVKPPDVVRVRADAARTMLDQLTDGSRRLVDSTGTEVRPQAGAAIEAPARKFRPDGPALAGYTIRG